MIEEKQGETEAKDAFGILENCVYTALETYSNVHRGSGHYSMATTHLFEQARKQIAFGMQEHGMLMEVAKKLGQEAVIDRLFAEQ